MINIETTKFHCGKCNLETNHKILATHETFKPYQWSCVYFIIECQGCNNVSFAKEYCDDNFIESDDNSMPYRLDSVITVYPTDDKQTGKTILKNKLSSKPYENFPTLLNNLYKQIIVSYNLGHGILAISGIRTLIEGICKELNINGGYIYNEDGKIVINPKKKDKQYSNNIQGKIYGLYENRHINFHHAQILQKIREKSNDSIHDVVVPEEHDLTDIINIVEQLILNAFEFKHHRLLK